MREVSTGRLPHDVLLLLLLAVGPLVGLDDLVVVVVPDEVVRTTPRRVPLGQGTLETPLLELSRPG